MAFYYVLTLRLCPDMAPAVYSHFAFSHPGEHKDRICLWQESITPTFLSYVLTSVLSAPLSLSLLLCSDTKTLAHIAVYCKAMQTLKGHGEVKHTMCRFLNYVEPSKLSST